MIELTNPLPLTAADLPLDRFADNGVAVRPRLLDEPAVADLLRHVTEDASPTPPVFELWTNSPVVALAQSVLGGPVNGHTCNVRHVRAGTGDTDQGLHQDAAFLLPDCAHPDFLQVTIWLAVSDVGVDDAPLLVLPGSHTRARRHQPIDGDLVLTAEERPAGGELRSVPVAAGSAIVFHHLLVHGTGSHTGRVDRRSIDLRFQRPFAIAAEHDLGFPIAPRRRFADLDSWRAAAFRVRPETANAAGVRHDVQVYAPG